MMLKLFPKRLNNPFENHQKHDSGKQLKISSKGRPEAPKRESKVAQRRRKGPQGAAGTALKLGLFLLFSLTRPKASPRPSQTSQNGFQNRSQNQAKTNIGNNKKIMKIL